MLDKIRKIKENKVLKFIWNILYTLMYIIVALILVIVVMQRFSNNNIAIGGFRIFSVATGSMVPVYNVGDTLISKEIEPEKIKVGDDLVYQGKQGSFSGKIVTHRVISIEKKEDGNYKIIMQGVANNMQDPEIDQTQVYGKVICKVHFLSFLQKLIKNSYAFYFGIVIIVGTLIYRNIKNIIRIESGDLEEEEDEVEK